MVTLKNIKDLKKKRLFVVHFYKNPLHLFSKGDNQITCNIQTKDSMVNTLLDFNTEECSTQLS